PLPSRLIWARIRVSLVLRSTEACRMAQAPWIKSEATGSTKARPLASDIAARTVKRQTCAVTCGERHGNASARTVHAVRASGDDALDPRSTIATFMWDSQFRHPSE